MNNFSIPYMVNRPDHKINNTKSVCKTFFTHAFLLYRFKFQQSHKHTENGAVIGVVINRTAPLSFEFSLRQQHIEGKAHIEFHRIISRIRKNSYSCVALQRSCHEGRTVNNRTYYFRSNFSLDFF